MSKRTAKVKNKVGKTNELLNYLEEIKGLRKDIEKNFRGILKLLILIWASIMISIWGSMLVVITIMAK